MNECVTNLSRKRRQQRKVRNRFFFFFKTGNRISVPGRGDGLERGIEIHRYYNRFLVPNDRNTRGMHVAQNFTRSNQVESERLTNQWLQTLIRVELSFRINYDFNYRKAALVARSG